MFKKISFLPVVLLLTNIISADSYNNYLFAKFGDKPIEEKKVENPLDQKFTLFKPELFDAQTHNISDREGYEIAFANSSEKNSFSKASTVIDQLVVNKMELIIGDEHKQASFMHMHMDKHLSTAFGAKQTINMLSNPTDDFQEILKRQAIITELIENEELFNELDNLVTQQTIVEKQLLALFGSNPIVNPNVLNNMVYNNFPGTKWLNKNYIGMELSDNRMLLLPSAVQCFNLAKNIKYKIHEQNIGIFDATTETGKELLQGMKKIPSTIYNFAKFIIHNAELNDYIVGIPPLFFMGFGLTTIYKTFKTKSVATKHIQQLLIDIATYNTISKRISLLIASNEILSTIPELQNIATFGNAHSASGKLQTILSKLRTNTFKGKPAYFSLTGRVLATYTNIQDVKNEFIPLMEAVGTLDMYLAVAKLYKEHQNKSNSFCFAEFVESNTPLLEAEGFWNPFINANTAIPNDARLGNDIPNIVLTGPNECGKSTILKGLTINVLLAQTFGIAPAKSLRLTPFSKVNCYLNITDDTSAGKSLFRAQVEMSKKLIEELRNMPADKFVFTIMDELFTGTSAHEGEQAAYIYAEKLMVFENSITVMATHFDKLKELEKASNGKYVNFQVEAIREEDNTITRTFKMKPGFSTMNIAFDILAQAGVI